MAQKIFTKRFGEIDVERSWVDGPHHIALLTDGAYCHISGLPIYSKAELRCVLSGPDLEEAERWFDNRDKDKGPKARRILFDGDGYPVFEDGTKVTSPSDLTQNLKRGPVLDAALMALGVKMVSRRQEEAKVEEVKKQVEELEATQVAKKVTKRFGGKKAKKSAAKPTPGPEKVAPAQV